MIFQQHRRIQANPKVYALCDLTVNRLMPVDSTYLTSKLPLAVTQATKGLSDIDFEAGQGIESTLTV